MMLVQDKLNLKFEKGSIFVANFDFITNFESILYLFSLLCFDFWYLRNHLNCGFQAQFIKFEFVKT